MPILMYAALILLCATISKAQGLDLPGMKSPWSNKKILRLAQSRNSASSLTGSTEKVQTRESDLHLTWPYEITTDESLRFSLQHHQVGFSPNPSNPPDLSSLEFGVAYSRPLSDASIGGIALRYGSASDRLFADENVTFVNATATWVRPKANQGQWIWLLNYSNNRPFWNNIPLPGFAYAYSPHSDFQGVFGFPFAFFNWKLQPDWALQVFSVLPWRLKTSLSYHLRPHIPLSLGLDISHQTYFRAERQDRRERLFFEEKKLFVGFRSPLARWLMFDLEAGRAYERRVFESTEYRAQSDKALGLDPSAYLRLGVMIFTD